MTVAPLRACAFWLCIATALAQEPAVTDWRAEVEKACTHARYGLRLAAARKIAEAGDAAVTAVQAVEKEKGKDAVPVSLVDAYVQRGGNGPLTMGLLTGWATDRDFFWRGQAMLGLAQRARKDATIAKNCAKTFQDHVSDPAWLVRTHARLGAQATGLDESDPRAACRLAALLLAEGNASKLEVLIDALSDERTFLGDPWGRRRAIEAITALKAWLGDDRGYRADAAHADNVGAIVKLARAAWIKAGELEVMIHDPRRQMDSGPACAGGIEVLSCKLGDLFLCWSEDGVLTAGIARDQKLKLPREKFTVWAAGHAAIKNDGQQGVVICDKLRVKWDAPAPPLHFNAAPAALPQTTVDWLRSLATLIEETGDTGLAAALRERLQQFAPGPVRG